MARKLKVYGWQSFRNGTLPNGRKFYGQTREIMAAPSAAEVMRVTGMTRSEWTHSGCETGNEHEVELAMAFPGVVWWAPLNHSLRANEKLWVRG